MNLARTLLFSSVALLLATDVALAAPAYTLRMPIAGLRATPTPAVTNSDPYWTQVTALLTMDGADGATSLSDAKGGNYTTGSTGAKLTTSVSMFGTGALSTLSGYATGPASALAFGTQDFTVEFFARASAARPYCFIEGRPSVNGPYFMMDSYGVYVGGGYISSPASSQFLPTDNAFHHVAYSRAGSTGRLFVDGKLVATAADGANYQAGQFTIGANTFGIVVDGFYLDELRITKGVARYTSAFAAPTSAFPTQ
ncbi:LamG domain-containing protein [Paraburkholderia sp. UCT31]|uniref:LamG-like jellyroll fold domain-containing protein n=1 Tax=Paraburkholderia sp. UCT31 TaxID=2615209 RepID=UPI0016563E4F|nr:LamG-like jellyroll fold domain-containing protein [Paraburkholderia sp. UCT31]MBC8737357.1 LamG domain-containing protein [Paraburkholderia sp. UCT31]